MLTIAGGIILAIVILLVAAFVISGVIGGIANILDPYGQGRTKAQWRRDSAEIARHARSLKKTQEERDSLDRWFRSTHGASMDDL